MATPTSSEENQEAQQAQAIAEIKGRRVNRMNIAALNDGNTAESDLFAALEIVDSQAQKIASATLKLADSEAKRGVLISEIAEQAKEITLLREVVKKMEAAFSHSQEFDRRIVAPAHAALYEYDQKAKQQ